MHLTPFSLPAGDGPAGTGFHISSLWHHGSRPRHQLPSLVWEQEEAPVFLFWARCASSLLAKRVVVAQLFKLVHNQGLAGKNPSESPEGGWKAGEKSERPQLACYQVIPALDNW